MLCTRQLQSDGVGFYHMLALLTIVPRMFLSLWESYVTQNSLASSKMYGMNNENFILEDLIACGWSVNQEWCQFTTRFYG